MAEEKKKEKEKEKEKENEKEKEKKEQNLNFQNEFLSNFRKSGKQLTFYLVNGLPIKAKILSFDNFTVLVEKEDKKKMLIYKHAISSISE